MKKLERNKTDRKAPLPNPENIPLLLALGWLEEPSGNPFFNRIKSKTRITGNDRLRRGVSSVPYRPPQILPS